MKAERKNKDYEFRVLTFDLAMYTVYIDYPHRTNNCRETAGYIPMMMDDFEELIKVYSPIITKAENVCFISDGEIMLVMTQRFFGTYKEAIKINADFKEYYNHINQLEDVNKQINNESLRRLDDEIMGDQKTVQNSKIY